MISREIKKEKGGEKDKGPAFFYAPRRADPAYRNDRRCGGCVFYGQAGTSPCIYGDTGLFIRRDDSRKRVELTYTRHGAFCRKRKESVDSHLHGSCVWCCRLSFMWEVDKKPWLAPLACLQSKKLFAVSGDSLSQSA